MGEPGGELSPAGSVLMPAYAVWSRGGSRPSDLVPASLGTSVSLASCNCLIPTPGKGAASSFSSCWWLQGRVEETTLSHPSLLPPADTMEGLLAGPGAAGPPLTPASFLSSEFL